MADQPVLKIDNFEPVNMFMLHSRLKKLSQKLYPRHLFYAPEWLILGVNNSCNLHCKMCDVGTGYSVSNFSHHLLGAKPVNMPLELFQIICNELSHFYPDARLGYAFTEPLIYPYLLESLEYAKNKKIITSVTTNGLKLKELARDLSQCGLNTLMVSIDGPPITHNMIRGNTHAFESAFEGIQKVLEYSRNKVKISVYYTITEWNFDKMSEFVDYFKKIPLERIGFMHPNFTNGTMVSHHNNLWGNIYPATESNLTQMDPDNISLPGLYNEIQELRKIILPFPLSFSPELNSLQDLEIYYKNPAHRIGKRCNDAFRNIMVKSNGEVIPSHGRCYNVVAGNLYQNNLQEIWNSSTIAQFRKDLMKSGGLMPACTRCCSAF